MKVCATCDKSLPEDQFPVGRGKDQCKGCTRAHWRAEREVQLTANPTAEKHCPKCKLVLDAALFAKDLGNNDGLYSWCRECSNLHKIERLYGVAPAHYKAMIETGCQICGSFDNLHVDHDHSCCPSPRVGGKTCGECVRGVLCQQCNHGLGNFRDDPQVLVAAINYLKR